MAIVVDTSGLKDFENFYKLFPQRAAKALSLAINDTVRDVVLPEARKHIYAEVNFPQGYLDERLKVTQFATPTQLVAIVAGRDRPTSLARFAEGAGTRTAGGWTPVSSIQVSPGSQRKMRNAFLIPLRAGVNPNGNVGLAIRLRPGERVRNVHTFDPIQIFPNVYILYGPSVDQVFKGVAADIQPEVVNYLESEFGRQFLRLGR